MYYDIEPPKPKKCAQTIRIINIVSASVIIIAFGFVGIIFMAINSLLSAKFFLVFSPLFMILFGVMMISAEFKLGLLEQHFGFLKSLLGRGIFNLYLSSSVFFYFSCGNSDTILAWVSAMVIFLIGLLYIFLHFYGGSSEYSHSLKQQLN